MASLGVSPPYPWLRVPQGLGAGSDALQAPARWGRGKRGMLCTGGGTWNVGDRSSCHPTSPSLGA